MADDLIDGPGAVTSISWENNAGRLMLFTPRSTVTDFPTMSGPGEVVRADVVILDGPDAGTEFRDTVIFPRVLQGQLRRNVGTGRRNLGRLGKGEKKPGQTAPWILLDPNDADLQLARSYLAGQKTAGRTGGSVGSYAQDEPPF